MERYVILPKKENGKLLEKYEILIYVCIRRYMNKDTMEAFPSLDTIAHDSGCSKPTVMKVIDKIRDKGYIEIKTFKKGLGRIYKFNNEKSFEPFSYEFLDKKELSKAEKLQILCTQQYMYKNNGVGKISYSDRQLEELTGLNRHLISKNNQSLIQKGYASQVTVQTRDKETGLLNKETIYHLDELGQAIVFAIQNHENRIQKNEDDIEFLKKTVKHLLEANNQQSRDYKIALDAINKLQEENNRLKSDFNGNESKSFAM